MAKKISTPSASPMQNLLENDPILANLPQVGDIVEGEVINASKKEVLLSVNGVITGIIRGRELYNESEEFASLKPGARIEATVLELDNEKGMLELSFRYAGHQKTWSALQKNKEENQTILAKVKDANKGGLLITVNHVNGFLPVSQLSSEFYPRIQGGDKNKILEKLKSYVGKVFKVKIIDLDEATEKLIVSEKNSWEEDKKDTLNKYKVGDVIDGTVTAVTDFGVFVEFGEKLEGLIHISELAWQRIDDPRDLFSVGNKVKAEIINIDGSKIFLSSKKLKNDPWKDIAEKFKVGDAVEGTVIKATPYGLFVELDKDIHGLAHISELSDKPIESMEAFARPGSKMKFKIVSLEQAEHRLGLSVKALKEKQAKTSPDAEKKQDEIKKEQEAEVIEQTENEPTKEEKKEKKEKKKKTEQRKKD